MNQPHKIALVCLPVLIGLWQIPALATWSDTIDHTAQVVISAAAVPLSMDIDAATDLTEGDILEGRELANWRVYTDNGQQKQLGVAFSIGSYTSCDPNGYISGMCIIPIFAGTNNPENKLALKLTTDQDSSVKGNGFAIKLTSNASLSEFSGKLVSPELQTVAPDTYTIQLTAAVWNP